MKLNQTHFKYGLITALAMIVVNVALYVSDMSFRPGAQYIGFIPLLAGLILNAQAFSKANAHYVTFGKVFGSGFKATALIILVLLGWSILATYVIFPEMKTKSLEKAMEGMEREGLSEERIEQGMELMKKGFTVFLIAGVVFGTMLMGALCSLVAAATAKKNGNRNPTL
jgi:hypothetical protein